MKGHILILSAIIQFGISMYVSEYNENSNEAKRLIAILYTLIIQK